MVSLKRKKNNEDIRACLVGVSRTIIENKKY